MERNVKLLWGVIGFAVLMGFVLPSAEDLPGDSEMAEQSTAPAPEPACAIASQPVQQVEMTAEMPTEFALEGPGPLLDPVPTGIDGSPTAGAVDGSNDNPATSAPATYVPQGAPSRPPSLPPPSRASSAGAGGQPPAPAILR